MLEMQLNGHYDVIATHLSEPAALSCYAFSDVSAISDRTVYISCPDLPCLSKSMICSLLLSGNFCLEILAGQSYHVDT